VTFSVVERLLLLSLLPAEGDLTTLRIIRKLREDLSFSEEEHKALNFRAEGGQTLWEAGGDISKEIAIGPKAHVLIVDTLTKMDKEKKLRVDHLSLCEKFEVGSNDA